MQHERFLLINRLLEHGFALEQKLMRVRASVRDVLQADAQAWYDLYMAWYSDTVPQLDADLQARFQTAHLGTDAGPGTQRILELLVQACDDDPAIAAPAYEIIRPQFWHVPLGDPLHAHLETLETARRRTFPATHAVPGAVKDAMAAACWRFHDETIDHIFINNECEPQWWVRPLRWYKRQSEQRIHGWLDAIQVYASNREIAIVRAVCTHLLPAPRLTDAQRVEIQSFLAQTPGAASFQTIPLLTSGTSAQRGPGVSCFISYSSRDQAFAERLHADLQVAGVTCWYAPHDLPIGNPIVHGIDAAIRQHDAVVLVLSESSVTSGWVEYEVLLTLTRERDEHRSLLFPIRLDDAVLHATRGWTADLRARHIGDFRGWKQDDEYQQVLQRLVRDLRQARYSTGEHERQSR